jgi:hypothetical protein
MEISCANKLKDLPDLPDIKLGLPQRSDPQGAEANCKTQFQFRGALLPTSIWHINGQRIGHMENKLKRRRLFPRVWVGYVNDVFAMVHKDEVLDLLTLLNSQQPINQIHLRDGER